MTNLEGLDAAEFMADIGALSSVEAETKQQQFEQPHVEPNVIVPNAEEIDKKIEAEIQNDIAIEKELDDILKTIEENISTDKTNTTFTDNVNTNINNNQQQDISDKLSLEEQERIINLLEELETKYDLLAKEKSSREAEKEQILYENQKYRERIRNYIDKVQSLENDENRYQVDDQRKNLIYFSNELKKTDNPIQKKILEDKLKREAVRVTENIFGKSLDQYLADYYTLGGDDLSSGESFQQFNMQKILDQKRSQQPINNDMIDELNFL
jgi:hypothetical protein